MNVGNAKAHIVHCIHILKQDHKRPVTLHIPHEALKGFRFAAFGFFSLQHQFLSRAGCILAGHIFATCTNYEKIYAWHAALARHVLPAISPGQRPSPKCRRKHKERRGLCKEILDPSRARVGSPRS